MTTTTFIRGLALLIATAMAAPAHAGPREGALRLEARVGQAEYPVAVDPHLVLLLSNVSDEPVTACKMSPYDQTLQFHLRRSGGSAPWQVLSLSGEILSTDAHAPLTLAAAGRSLVRLPIPHAFLDVGTWELAVSYECDRSASGEVGEIWTLAPPVVTFAILEPSAREREALEARQALLQRLRADHDRLYADVFLSELAPKYVGVPSFAPDHYNAAASLARRGDARRARIELETVIRDYPPFDGRGDALALLARLEFEQGRVEAGRKALSQLRQCDPDRDVTELEALGRTMEQK